MFHFTAPTRPFFYGGDIYQNLIWPSERPEEASMLCNQKNSTFYIYITILNFEGRDKLYDFTWKMA